jgi:endonuclease G, mitochondrial
MSNICPQKPKLNQQVWRLLEAQIADDYAERLEQVWIVTGPIFGATIERLESGVAIPEAFFKVIIDEDGGTVRTRAYIVPQSVEGSEPADSFLTTVDAVELRTGLDLMSELADTVESEVESTTADLPW